MVGGIETLNVADGALADFVGERPLGKIVCGEDVSAGPELKFLDNSETLFF